MSIGLEVLVQEVTERVAAKNDQMLLRKFLRSLKLYSDGGSDFNKGDMAAAILKHESAVEVLPLMPETMCILAIIQGALVSAYAVAGRLKDAVTTGERALEHLNADPSRLGMAHANCLHDMGGAMVKLGHRAEGIELMERALRVYETVPDGAEGAARCMRNIGRLKAIMSRDTDTRPTGWFSKLFGGKARK